MNNYLYYIIFEMTHCKKGPIIGLFEADIASRPKRRNVCPTCEFVNYNDLEFVRHLNSHERVKSKSLSYCDNCYIKNPEFKHFQSQCCNRHICGKCNYETYDRNEFIDHWITLCNTDANRIFNAECTKCEFTTMYTQEFRKHLKCHKLYTIDDFDEIGDEFDYIYDCIDENVDGYGND